MDQINFIQLSEPALKLYISVGVHIVSEGVKYPQPCICAFEVYSVGPLLDSTVLKSSNPRTTNQTAQFFYKYGY